MTGDDAPRGATTGDGLTPDGVTRDGAVRDGAVRIRPMVTARLGRHRGAWRDVVLVERRSPAVD